MQYAADNGSGDIDKETGATEAAPAAGWASAKAISRSSDAGGGADPSRKKCV